MILFEYAVLRVGQGDGGNVGVLLFCADRELLIVEVQVDRERLRSLAADLDMTVVREALDAVCLACAGAGPVGALPLRQRFDWLTGPSGSPVRAGPVHPGVAEDPAAEMARLLDKFVR